MKNNEFVEINVADIFYLLLQKLHFIILLTLIGAVAAYAVAKFALPVKYTSSVSIYVNNALTAEQTYTEKANYADIQTSRQLADTYIVILQNDEVFDEVSSRLLEEYHVDDLKKMFSVSYEDDDPERPYISAGQLRRLVSIKSVNNTEVIQITCTSLNPQISADICSYISDFAPNILIRTTKAGSVEPIGHAKIAKDPSSPNVRLVTMIGIMLGFVIGVLVVIISDLMDTRIKVADDIKKKFPDVPILAEIPDLYTNKGGFKYE